MNSSNKNNEILILSIFLATVCITACEHSRPYDSPLSPLSPPPVYTYPAVTAPAPTPTAITSLTWPPRSTPTWAPTLVPTPQPSPEFPSEARIPQGWPPLPEDLYFIRDGRLWRWPSEGQVLQQIVATSYQYRITPDGHYVLYAVDTTLPPGLELIVSDLVTGESVPIPTARNFEGCPLSGSSFDITPDGRYVVYIAWNVQPATGSRSPGLSDLATSPRAGGCGYGTIFAVDVQNINHEFELGYCTARSEYGWELRCYGFVLSPDGGRIAFSDGRGLWLSDIPQGTPRLIAEHQHLSSFCGVWIVRNWLPDGKHLLIDVGCFEGGYSAVMDVETGTIREVSHTWSYPDPYVAISWSQDGTNLLVNDINFESGIGPAYLVQVPVEEPIQETIIISATWPGSIWPTEPHSLPNGRIGFANQQCVDSEGMRSGIYTIERDGTDLEFVSPLPEMPCYVSDGIRTPLGTVLWSPDGIAYLYFGLEQRPSLLGLTDGSVLWDVRELLANAYHFQWRPPHAGY